MKVVCRGLLIFLLFCASWLPSQEQELLKSSDVRTIMNQIFEQHLEKKKISTEILRNSFRVYLDQFDPERSYLLESEVRPFLEVSETQLQRRLSQYKEGDFSVYSQINEAIQRAIYRARQLRQDIEQESRQLFQQARADDENFQQRVFSDADLSRPYPRNIEELKARIRQEIVDFIALQKRRFGESMVMRKSDHVLALYKKNVRNRENQYLFQNDQGRLLPPQEQENFFVLHVLKALASSLDAHTTFLDHQEAYDMKVRLEKELLGIGVVLQEGLDGIYVVEIISGSPADRSGQIKVNDQLIKIDSQSLSFMEFGQVLNLLRGEEGSSVTLSFKREGTLGYSGGQQVVNVKLKRESIVLDDERVDVSYESFGNGIIGKMTLHSFYEGRGLSSERDIRDAIRHLQRKGNLRGFILDLRTNSGGYLSQAIKVAGLFITSGVVVISKYADGEERYYRDVDGKIAYDGPFVVLTSRATASAAEIVAQALQDYGVALVVGDERTYGKGSIQSQTVTHNQGSSFFKVTVGKYYTVSGRSTQIRGVEADIVVPSQYGSGIIGEEYLQYPLVSDTIPSAFSDQLKDVPPNVKAWYLKYYVPRLQPQENLWRKMVPLLKKNSAYRIHHNKNYQLFLGKTESSIEEERERELLWESRHKTDFGAEDPQMAEAINIVKDMIMLESRWTTDSLGSIGGTENMHDMAGVSHR